MTPISSSLLDALAGVTAPTAKTAALTALTGMAESEAAPDTSAIDWILTWLGQMGEPQEESPTEGAESSAPVAAAHQTQWLTLLPSVPAFQPLFVTVGLPEQAPGEIKEKPPVNSEPMQPVDPVLPVAPKGEELKEDQAETDTQDSRLAPVPVAPLIALQEAPVLETTSASAAAAPLQQPKVAPESSEAAPVRPSPPNTDKGEVIWSAEFVVNSTAAPLADAPDVPIEQIEPQHAMESSKPNEPVSRARIGEAGHRQAAEQHEEEGGDPAGQQEQPQQRAQAAKSIVPERVKQAELASTPVKRETPVPEHTDGKAAEISSRPIFSPEFTAHSAEIPESAPVLNVASAESVDTAKPLRPAQIATLQVDVPAPANNDGAAPMRLIVSQRGEQVNVRLRSWDASTAPIEVERMEPLLHSLADKGFMATETVPEGAAEKPLASAQSGGSNTDQQSFRGADDRQQQNQQRQQQQQSFFLRKQMRNLPAGEFDPGLVLGPNHSIQQGAVR